MYRTMCNRLKEWIILPANGVVFGLSLTEIEDTLKIILLTASIIYTVISIYQKIKNKKR